MTTPVREFINEEYYHIYNQGADKRDIFLDEYDLKRFIQTMMEFNTTESTGGIYANRATKDKNNKSRPQGSPLVEIIAYCLNPNHFHLLLKQVSDNGISIFMNKLGGYSKYFNLKNKRRGTLFQGRFKVKHIKDDDYLLNLSVYINLNDRVHQINYTELKLVERSSWKEYIDNRIKGICTKDIILGQFKSNKDYQIFSEEIVLDFIERKKETKEIETLIIEEN